MNPPFTLSRMIGAGIRHSWRVSASVAFGVATATAVIVGALLVGDSMRGSLRGLTVERLGKTEVAIVPGGFFEPTGIVSDDHQPIPLILFDRSVVEFQTAGSTSDSIRRAGGVQVIGCDRSFWDLDVSGNVPEQYPDQNSVVLNEATANELGVKIGDLVTVRLPAEQAVPADSPLGRRDIQSEGLPRMKVVDIIADRGLGRFSISPSQASPQIIFIDRATIGDVLERSGQANMLLFTTEIKADDLHVDLEDIGLSLKRVQREYSKEDQPAETIFDYYSLTSDRLLLPELVVERVMDSLSESNVSESSTYLANAIERLDAEENVVATVPYSTITAIDSTPSLPLNFELPAGSDRVPLALNSWAAERLDASVGTELRIAYFEPEVENGKEIERFFDGVVTDIVPVTRPATPYRRKRVATFDQPPTVYNDPDLTPTVPGVTDQDSISDWDLPFPLERKIANEDDVYWKEYRLTPKAFLPLADGKRLFGSRFGETTGLRIQSTAAENEDQLRTKIDSVLKPSLSELGWAIQPIRQLQLSASKGTTPFDGLFLSLSFFVILAAVMLIAMLFRLGLVQRMQQFGTLLTLGWTPGRVGRLAMGEGLFIAAFGVLIGIGGGILYAKGVLWALRSWWVGAVTVPFLSYHWTPTSLMIGAMAGWFVAAITLWMTVRWLLKLDAQTLLSGRDQDISAKRDTKPSKLPKVAMGTAIAAVLVAAFGASMGGQTAAGGFVGGGMMLLIAALVGIYARLKQPRRITDGRSVAGYSVGAMASRNASRHPLRSTMTIGLMATAAFLIIAISAFRLQPTDQGTGGFNLAGQSAQSLNRDLRDPQVRADVIGPQAAELDGTTVASLRMRLGQDASCNNLYQATRPTVLGIPESFAELFQDGDNANGLPGFAFAAATSDQSPWDALATPATGTEDDPIPVIIDQNTAMWSLQMMKGISEKRTFEYESGKPITFQVVGLLSNSMLQGRLMIGEGNFQTIFPDISGYQYFLFATPPDRSKDVASVLENRLGDIGMDVSDTKEILSGMLAVQNTYLRTFQSLGGLGLLLGTIGLAVSQLRSVLERRQELAVMRAIGFSQQRLAAVVMSETASLLLMGIGCGAICAVLAVLPHAILSNLKPPVMEPLLIVLIIIVFGMLAGLIAVRRVAKMPLLESLRSE
ncbi:MAG: ABC transporter permease [Rubripirellula sp.]